ncbi:MAG: alpha/beta hydrolase [Actinomycetota bacterium]|nr:alpha/beta hydrolase [Actinomycetota bacterium]MED5233075.1 alpha/beta hydrolase [Actinomycetota bacterium]MED5393016.1 alpha/beta hydrolase [Actinomycetota bacterium]MEE3352705.1 alpha/beta hydrolase [Actinomycetota bacterium]
MTLRWASMTGADRQREYSPSSYLPNGDYQPHIREYLRASEAAWARASDHPAASTTTIRYGDDEAHAIDVMTLLGDPPAPLLAFIHGGYWQELSRVESRFPAATCISRGWNYAAIDHTLAPSVPLDRIVDECRRAVHTLAVRAEALGLDPDRIVLAGHSAGAHLAAMVAADPDGIKVAGLILVSGIYELEPLIGTTINNQLGLDPVAARRNSPLLIDTAGFPTTLVAHGSDETSEFKAQSAAFNHHLEAAGTTVTMLEVAKRNHFDVILDLTEPDTPLGEAVGQLVRSL